MNKNNIEKQKLVLLALDLQHELSGMVLEMGIATMTGTHGAVIRSAYDHRHEFMNNRAMELVYVLGALAAELQELVGVSLRMLDAESAYSSFEGESGIADECEAARDAFKALVGRLAHEVAV